MDQVTRKKMVVVGKEVLPLGLKLAGIKEAYVVDDADKAEHALRELFERKDVGIIVINEGLASAIKDRRVRFAMENSLDPVVISVPGYKEKEMKVETLRRLILRVLGIDIAETRKA